MFDPTAFLPKTSIDDDPPRTPLRGGLVLTGTQERALAKHFVDRAGRAQNSFEDSEWLKKRNIAMAHFGNDMSDRKAPKTIFEKSNMTINLPKRYVRITSSRAYDELLTSSPMISVSAEGNDDAWDDASAIERYCSYKLEQAGLRAVLREAQMLACIRGEAVVKTTWKRRTVRSIRSAVVLLDEASGKVLLANDGNPITQKDAFIDGLDGRKVLARDQKMKLPDVPKWGVRNVSFVKVVYNGLDAATIDHRDFICSTTARDVHEADFVGIRTGIPIDNVYSMLLPLGKGNALAVEFLNKLGSNISGGRDAGSNSEEPEARRGEGGESADAVPSCKFIEVYARVLISEDGQSDEIAALLDIENEQFLAYDYLSNISPTNQRPFRVLRMEPVPNRWYGTGFYELFADRHKFCDLFLNRVNLGASLSGNIKIENPSATEEGLAGEMIEFGTDKTYRLREGYTVDDVFKVIPIPNDTAASQNVLNMLMQMAQLEAGVVSAGDHAMASLPSSNLAAGIKSLDRVANVILKNILFDFVSGADAILADAVAIILATHDQLDSEKLMGSDNSDLLEKYRDPSLFSYKIKLRLAVNKDSEIIENHTRAMELLMQWASMDVEVRERLRSILLKILKVMGIEDAEKSLEEFDPEAAPAEPAGKPDNDIPDAVIDDVSSARDEPVVGDRTQVTDDTTMPVEAVIK